jgi:S-adenosylmethionine synthetase
MGEGAPELKSLIGQGANDTSIGIGYAPLDRIERLVLDIESAVRSVQSIGEDTKITAVRNGRDLKDLKIVIAAAMISRYISHRWLSTMRPRPT